MDGTVVARCCQDWEVPATGLWGTCGRCGERPLPIVNDVDPKLVTLTY